MNFFYKIINLLLDPRMPYFLPWHFLKKLKSGPKIKADQGKPPIYFALTVDVEQDYGSLGPKKTASLPPFFDKFSQLLKTHNLPATFFVQGDLVDPAQSDQINRMILKCLSQGDLNKLGENGYQLVKKEFTWENTVAKNYQIYQKLTSNKSILKNEKT